MQHKAHMTSRNAVVDKLKMLAIAVVVIVVGLSAFYLTERYHVDPAWVFMAIASLSFLPVIGWDYRSHFKSPLFMLFLAFWSLIHGLVFVVVMRRFGWVYWVGALLLELFIFYAITDWLFGLEPDEDSPPPK
jgi:hypothetical protein